MPLERGVAASWERRDVQALAPRLPSDRSVAGDQAAIACAATQTRTLSRRAAMTSSSP